MSRFRRSSHYRTNSSGTTFLVREHDVARDEWEVAAPRASRPGPTSAFSADAYGEPGIIYPNARCPVCSTRVYFFKASNGGRVFFDTLWPDWDKHPCTISDVVELMDGSPVAEEEEVEGTNCHEIEVYERAEGQILAVRDEDGDRSYFVGRLDLSIRYLTKAWLNTKTDTYEASVLTILGGSIGPINIPVTPGEPPLSLTDATRMTLSAGMRKGLIAASKRVVGLTKSFLQTKSGYGTFVAGWVGDSRVVIVPVHVDQVRWDFNSFEPVGDYMGMAAANILRLVADTSSMRPKRLMRDHVIFVVADPFRYVRDGMDDEVYPEKDGAISKDAFSYDGARSLEKVGLNSVRWVDVTDATPILITETPASVSEVICREEAFYDTHWPSAITGRWRQIERLAETVGVSNAFLLRIRLCAIRDGRSIIPMGLSAITMRSSIIPEATLSCPPATGLLSECF